MTILSEGSEWDSEDVTIAPILQADQNTNLTAQEGDDVTFSVTLSTAGGSPFHVQWTRGGSGSAIEGDRFIIEGSSLRLRGAQLDDADLYKAVATNAAGESSIEFHLDVHAAPGDVPRFVRRLNDLAVKVGTRTRLLVEIRSATDVKTVWYREDREIPDSDRYHFLHEGSFYCVDVAPVTLEDSGLWSCVAHNAEGRSSCSCRLNVLVPKAYKKPEFVEQLKAVLTEGGTVSLECKVIGVPTPQLRWFKDGEQIKAGDVFALSADPADPTTLGTYTCEATNCMGRAISSSRVHVNAVNGGRHVDSLLPSGPVPKFIEDLQNEKVKIGGQMTLQCKVEVPPWPSKISWFNSQGEVQEGGRYHLMADGLGSYSCAVDPIEVVDQGQWKCVATSDLGLKSMTVSNVAVSFPKNYRAPRFLESLRAVLTEEGLVSFECKVVGYPTPHLQWFKDGQELKPGDVYQLTGTNSLGSYCCIARNCMGEAKSTAELTVEDIQSQLSEEEKLQLADRISSGQDKIQPPRFLIGLKSAQANINEPFKFTVQVTINPEPVVAWYRDDEEVLGSDSVALLKETHGVCHLSFTRLEFADQAEWKCVATNDYGQSVTSCFLKLNIPKHFKKPRFLECLRAVLSEEGAVNLECKVIGVPQPTLKWYKDGRELKPGDIHKIISGEDGTCCLGVYTCEAHNCMGIASSSASLLGFEEHAALKQEAARKQAAAAAAPALTRQPSLSTIQEERTSQLQEVSFSFDGKEVSVSLYETPDLTEEEALQIVEMYAEELSEHVSEHNVVELPPMRFVKETSTSGHILMEAVVIDVSPEYYASAEDDMRTDADLDEFSITEEPVIHVPNVFTSEDIPYDKMNSEFFQRSLAPVSTQSETDDNIIPKKVRKKESPSKGRDSDKSSSGPYSDAFASEKETKSQKDSFASAVGSPEKEISYDFREHIELETKSSPAVMETNRDLTAKTKVDVVPVKRSKSRSQSKEKEIPVKRSKSRSLSKDKSSDESHLSDSKKRLRNQKHVRRKSRSESEIEDDSLQEFERRKALDNHPKYTEAEDSTSPEIKKKNGKIKSTDSEREDDSLVEFENRKSIKDTASGHELKRSRSRDQAQKRAMKKRGSTDSSSKEDDSLVEYEKRKTLSTGASSIKTSRSKKGGLNKRGSSESSEKEEDVQKEEIEKKRKKKGIKQITTVSGKETTPETGVEVIQSSETDSVGRGIVLEAFARLESRDDGDETTEFDTAEDSAYDKSEMSVLESLTQSLHEIQKGLAKVEEQIISESSEEPETAKSSLSVIESLVQPINELKKSIEVVEKQIEEESTYGDYNPSKAGLTILETLAQPVQEFERSLALVEQQTSLEGFEESLLERTSQSILDTVVQPLQELHRDIALIQQQAVMEASDPYSDILQSFKSPFMEVQGGILQSEKDFTSKVEDLSDMTTVIQPTYAEVVDELQKGLTQLVEQSIFDSTNVYSTADSIPMTIVESEKDKHEREKFIEKLKIIEETTKKEADFQEDRLDKCMKIINKKIINCVDDELQYILKSVCNFEQPLRSLQNITNKCIADVSENTSSTPWDVRPSSKEEMIQSLTRPFEVLNQSITLLEKIATTETLNETRGLGMVSLYKLAIPIDELKTTIKLVENLSSYTAIEFLSPPVENMLSALSTVSHELSKDDFIDNIPTVGENIIKGLDDSVDVMVNCINSIEKYSPESIHSYQKERGGTSLYSLVKPLEEFQKNLHSLQVDISDEDKVNSLNTVQVYHMAQDLGKPLHAIRIELSIIKHQIELDEYSSLSLQPSEIILEGNTVMTNLLEPVENVQKSVSTFYESIICRTPEEPIHIRYVLLGLKNLIQPVNSLCSSIMKTEEQILQDVPSLSEPSLGLRIVTQSVHELRDSIESIKNQSHEILAQPEIVIISDILSRLSNPLAKVEHSLLSISDQVHEEDKTLLNINLLKTLAEPFKVLQKALISINNEFSNENISEAVLFELKQPVQELQRSILVIQDQVSFEYGDEPTPIESNIVTLQSLIQPMKTLKRHFVNIQKLIAEQNKSKEIQIAQKIVGISKVVHKLQLKVSSLMIQQSYFRVSKHTGHLELFPALQYLVQFLNDFERALNHTEQYIARKETVKVSRVKEKLFNNVQYLKLDMINLHKKLNNLKDLSPSDCESTEILTKAINEFTVALEDECRLLSEATSDETSDITCLESHFESFIEHINILHSKLLLIESKITPFVADEDSSKQTKEEMQLPDSLATPISVIEVTANALQSKLCSVMNLAESSSSDKNEKPLTNIVGNMLQNIESLKGDIIDAKQESDLNVLKEIVEDKISNKSEEIVSLLTSLRSEIQQATVAETIPDEILQSVETTIQNIVQLKIVINDEIDELSTAEETIHPETRVDKEVSVYEVIKPNEEISKEDLILGSLNIITNDIKENIGVSVSSEGIIGCMNESSDHINAVVAGISELTNNLFTSGEKKGRPDDEKEKLENHKCLDFIVDNLSKIKNEIISKRVDTNLRNVVVKNVEELQNAIISVTEEIETRHNLLVLEPLLEPLKQFSEVILNQRTPQTEFEKCEGLITEEITPFETLEEKSLKILEEFARVSTDLELGLMKVEHNILNAVDPSKGKTVNVDPLLQPIQQLSEKIALVEELTSESSEYLGEQASLSLSMLKTLAQPIREIENNILNIQQQALETTGKAEFGFKVLEAIAKPIRELRTGIALIQEQAVIVEPDAVTLSEPTKDFPIEEIATPLQELKNVLNSIIEQQAIVFEPNVESISEKDSLSKLQAIATPMNVLQKQLAEIQTQQILEGGADELSVKEALNELAKPVMELQQAIAKIESQEIFETIDKDISSKQIDALKKLARPLLEVSRGIACMTEQQVLDDVVSNTTISDLPTLASPTDVSLEVAVEVQQPIVLECHESLSSLEQTTKANVSSSESKGIATIEQKQILEAKGDLVPESSFEAIKLNIDVITEPGNIVVTPQPVVFENECKLQEEIKHENGSENFISLEQQAAVKEAQQVLEQSGNIKTEEVHLVTASVKDSSFKEIAVIEEQKSLSGLESLEQKCEKFSKAEVVQSLTEAVIEEKQQILSNIEQLQSEDSLSSTKAALTLSALEVVDQMQPLQQEEAETLSDADTLTSATLAAECDVTTFGTAVCQPEVTIQEDCKYSFEKTLVKDEVVGKEQVIDEKLFVKMEVETLTDATQGGKSGFGQDLIDKDTEQKPIKMKDDNIDSIKKDTDELVHNKTENVEKYQESNVSLEEKGFGNKEKVLIKEQLEVNVDQLKNKKSDVDERKEILGVAGEVKEDSKISKTLQGLEVILKETERAEEFTKQETDQIDKEQQKELVQLKQQETKKQSTKAEPTGDGTKTNEVDKKIDDKINEEHKKAEIIVSKEEPKTKDNKEHFEGKNGKGTDIGLKKTETEDVAKLAGNTTMEKPGSALETMKQPTKAEPLGDGTKTNEVDKQINADETEMKSEKTQSEEKAKTKDHDKEKDKRKHNKGVKKIVTEDDSTLVGDSVMKESMADLEEKEMELDKVSKGKFNADKTTEDKVQEIIVEKEKQNTSESKEDDLPEETNKNIADELGKVDKDKRTDRVLEIQQETSSKRQKSALDDTDIKESIEKLKTDSKDVNNKEEQLLRQGEELNKKQALIKDEKLLEETALNMEKRSTEISDTKDCSEFEKYDAKESSLIEQQVNSQEIFSDVKLDKKVTKELETVKSKLEEVRQILKLENEEKREVAEKESKSKEEILSPEKANETAPQKNEETLKEKVTEEKLSKEHFEELPSTGESITLEKISGKEVEAISTENEKELSTDISVAKSVVEEKLKTSKVADDAAEEQKNEKGFELKSVTLEKRKKATKKLSEKEAETMGEVKIKESDFTPEKKENEEEKTKNEKQTTENDGLKKLEGIIITEKQKEAEERKFPIEEDTKEKEDTALLLIKKDKIELEELEKNHKETETTRNEGDEGNYKEAVKMASEKDITKSSEDGKKSVEVSEKLIILKEKEEKAEGNVKKHEENILKDDTREVKIQEKEDSKEDNKDILTKSEIKEIGDNKDKSKFEKSDEVPKKSRKKKAENLEKSNGQKIESKEEKVVQIYEGRKDQSKEKEEEKLDKEVDEMKVDQKKGRLAEKSVRNEKKDDKTDPIINKEDVKEKDDSLKKGDIKGQTVKEEEKPLAKDESKEKSGKSDFQMKEIEEKGEKTANEYLEKDKTKDIAKKQDLQKQVEVKDKTETQKQEFLEKVDTEVKTEKDTKITETEEKSVSKRKSLKGNEETKKEVVKKVVTKDTTEKCETEDVTEDSLKKKLEIIDKTKKETDELAIKDESKFEKKVESQEKIEMKVQESLRKDESKEKDEKEDCQKRVENMDKTETKAKKSLKKDTKTKSEKDQKRVEIKEETKKKDESFKKNETQEISEKESLHNKGTSEAKTSDKKESLISDEKTKKETEVEDLQQKVEILDKTELKTRELKEQSKEKLEKIENTVESREDMNKKEEPLKKDETEEKFEKEDIQKRDETTEKSENRKDKKSITVTKVDDFEKKAESKEAPGEIKESLETNKLTGKKVDDDFQKEVGRKEITEKKVDGETGDLTKKVNLQKKVEIEDTVVQETKEPLKKDKTKEKSETKDNQKRVESKEKTGKKGEELLKKEEINEEAKKEVVLKKVEDKEKTKKKKVEETKEADKHNLQSKIKTEDKTKKEVEEPLKKDEAKDKTENAEVEKKVKEPLKKDEKTKEFVRDDQEIIDVNEKSEKKMADSLKKDHSKEKTEKDNFEMTGETKEKTEKKAEQSLERKDSIAKHKGENLQAEPIQKINKDVEKQNKKDDKKKKISDKVESVEKSEKEIEEKVSKVDVVITKTEEKEHKSSEKKKKMEKSKKDEDVLKKQSTQINGDEKKHEIAGITENKTEQIGKPKDKQQNENSKEEKEELKIKDSNKFVKKDNKRKESIKKDVPIENKNYIKAIQEELPGEKPKHKYEKDLEEKEDKNISSNKTEDVFGKAKSRGVTLDENEKTSEQKSKIKLREDGNILTKSESLQERSQSKGTNKLQETEGLKSILSEKEQSREELKTVSKENGEVTHSQNYMGTSSKQMNKREKENSTRNEKEHKTVSIYEDKSLNKSNDNRSIRMKSSSTDKEVDRYRRSKSEDHRIWVSSTSEQKLKRFRDESSSSESAAQPPKPTWTRRESKCKPYFCGRLMDRTSPQGARIKMSCSFIGSPEPTVKWMKDGLPLLYSTADPLAQRFDTKVNNGIATLEIHSASPSDCGRYTCVASNSFGEATTTATLRIFTPFEPTAVPPTFISRIQDEYKFSNDQLILECRVTGQPHPTTTWFKDGKEIPARGRYQQSEMSNGICQLIICGPEPSDSGFYTCRAQNMISTEQISDLVTFQGRANYSSEREHERLSKSCKYDSRRPQVVNLMTDHVIPAGGMLALHVQVKGLPHPQIKWFRGSEPVEKRALTLQEGGLYSLILSDVAPQEAGLYTCRASNAYGHIDTSAHVQILTMSNQIKGKPAMFIRRPDTRLTVAEGEDICVSLRLTGDPKPRVTWMKGLKDMNGCARSMKESLGDCVRLTLKRATQWDTGTYFIVAKNIYGSDRAFFTVNVRQRARSLTPISWDTSDTNLLLKDIHEMVQSSLKDVPGPVDSEPVVTDGGRTWLTLTWSKPKHQGAAPILAYKVEAWQLGEEGGARWDELGVTPISTFDAFELKPGASYKFRVTARNRFGWGEPTVTREPIVAGCQHLRPEIVTDLPGQLKALQSTNLTLQCEIRGEPQPDIRWYHDGREVAVSRSKDDRLAVKIRGELCSLLIRDLCPEDSGRYICEGTNKLGRASTFVRLLVVQEPRLLKAANQLKRIQDGDEIELTTLESPPQFCLRLRDRRVQTSYPVRLTCQVIGYPTPEVSWFKDGERIQEDDRHSFWHEENFQTLEISRARIEDNGQYSVTARNQHGSVSCRCQLIVDKGIKDYVSPGFLYSVDDVVTVVEGKELRLRAQVEAYPAVGITWHRDGIRLRQSRRLVITLDKEGRTELSLADVTPRDAGTYCCTAVNEVGRAETSCQVIIQPRIGGGVQSSGIPPLLSSTTNSDLPYTKPPMFLTKPRSTSTVEGDTVVIMCEVLGDPKPEVIWLRDWLKPGYYRDAPQFLCSNDGPQYRLEIPHVKLEFTGAYCVLARNEHGEARAVISLQVFARGQGIEGDMNSGQVAVKQSNVQTLPEIVRELKDIRCCDGDSVTLECKIYAQPLPETRWLKDGKILPMGGDISNEVDGDIARLNIQKVYPEDEGEYTCMAYNELGRALTSACLVVDGGTEHFRRNASRRLVNSIPEDKVILKIPEEKEVMVSRQLVKPPGFLSTPSTPRTTPSRSISPGIQVSRDFTTPVGLSTTRSRRPKLSSPKFYAVPHNRVAEVGETVRFQCSVAGHPIPWASWDKDGRIVASTARFTVLEQDDLRMLQIKEVTEEDAGLYRVTLENDYGSIEATARLEVISHRGSKVKGVRAWSASRASPTFGRRLVGSAARVGGTFTLSCDVQASPSPVILWYRNAEVVVRSERVAPLWDGRTACLKLKDLKSDDAGVYTCVAENELGRTRCSAELVVLDVTDPSDADLRPPVFVTGLPELTPATEGQPFELQVKLLGTQPLEVVWVKDDAELPDCMDFRYVDYGDGRFGLRIADVFTADAGIYACEAFNPHGDAITSGRLEVTETTDLTEDRKRQLYFTKTPTPLDVEPGNCASFCARLHSPADMPMHIIWSVAGQPVHGNCERFKVEQDGDSTILRIYPVMSCDIGPVSCRAHICSEGHKEPILGCTKCYVVSCTSRLATVSDNSEGRPAILLQGPEDTTALRGQRVILRAMFSGHPQPSVRWLKAGRELSSEGCMQIITTTDPDSTEGESSLILDPVSSDDSGKYVVSVENCLGADCYFASVAVEGPPDPPAGRPSATAMDDNCVTIAWSSPPYDGGCMVTGYRIEMKNNSDADWTVIADRCHSLSHVVHALTPGQYYAFRVRAENVHGASQPSIETFPVLVGRQMSDDYDDTIEIDNKPVVVQPGEEFVSRFEVLEELGKGRYGVVHRVIDRKSNSNMAAKFVRCIKKQDRQKVHEEIDIMNCLRHPKLLQLTASYENSREVIMVMEYITGGELFERVVADDFTLTERDCILFMRQICEGVEYMHQNSIVHLDLKPENIMCHTRTSHQIKVIDFGLAQKLSPDTTLRALFGTPEFIPPEIINYEPIGIESDMWSLGVICYVLLSGLSPFMGDNDAETFANITRADFDFDDEAFDAISQDSKDFISGLLVKRKEKRMSARQCLQHKWLSQCDTDMNCVKLSTDKLKKFIIRRKWQKTGNAIRALGRMATLSAASRRNSSSPRPSLSGGPGSPRSRMSSLTLSEDQSQYSNIASDTVKQTRVRMCSERSDSGFSDCSSHYSSVTPQIINSTFSISEENEVCCDSPTDSINTISPIKFNDFNNRLKNINISANTNSDSQISKTLNNVNNSNVSSKISSSSSNNSSNSDSYSNSNNVKTNNLVRSSPFLKNSFVDGKSSLQKTNKQFDVLSCTANPKQQTTSGIKTQLCTPERSFQKEKSPTLQKDAHILEKQSVNFQKAFAFWKR